MKCCDKILSRHCCFIKLSKAFQQLLTNHYNVIEEGDWHYIDLISTYCYRIGKLESEDFIDTIQASKSVAVELGEYAFKYMNVLRKIDEPYIDYILECGPVFSSYLHGHNLTSVEEILYNNQR